MYAKWTILLHGVPYALHPLTTDLAWAHKTFQFSTQIFSFLQWQWDSQRDLQIFLLCVHFPLYFLKSTLFNTASSATPPPYSTVSEDAEVKPRCWNYTRMLKKYQWILHRYSYSQTFFWFFFSWKKRTSTLLQFKIGKSKQILMTIFISERQDLGPGYKLFEKPDLHPDPNPLYWIRIHSPAKL